MDFILFAATPAPWNYLLGWSLSLLALFLSLIILVQRGRGGGLAGALGGMGGQSAFGTKAGDLFTRVTIGVAAVWILLCMLSIKVLNPSAGKPVFNPTEITLPADPKLTEQKDKLRTDGPVEGDDPGARVPAGDSKDIPPMNETPPPADGKTSDTKTSDSEPADSAPSPAPTKSDEKSAEPAKPADSPKEESKEPKEESNE